MKAIFLYHDLLNLYGDYANLSVLQKRFEDVGKTLEIQYISVEEYTELETADFIYIGAGTEKSLFAALKDVRRFKDDIKAFIANNKPMLCTGNSFALFGENITDLSGNQYEGLGFFDTNVKQISTRNYDEYIMRSDVLNYPVVGSLNSSLEVVCHEKPFFTTEICSSKNYTKLEGIVKQNFYATGLSGPLLARNPLLLDYFAKLIDKTFEPVVSDWFTVAENGYRKAVEILRSDINTKG